MTPLAFAILSLLTFVTAGTAWFRRIRRVAVPTNPAPFLALWALTAALGAACLATPGAAWPSITIALVTILGSSIMLILHALGAQRAENAIRVGDSIPVFTASDQNGETFESASLAGHLLLIKFFRGHW